MEHFIIHGGKRLHGQVQVLGSKNATVALMMAALVNRGKTTLKNVPEIEEVNRLIEVLESIGVTVQRTEKTLVIIPPKKVSLDRLDKEAAEKTRSIILLIGALAGRVDNYNLPQAGGCRLGSRTIKPHIFGLEKLGVHIKNGKKELEIKSDLKAADKIVLYESGDTVTENILMAAAQTKGKTIVKLASANYMVQEVCFFLEKLGVKIKGIGTSTLEIEGVSSIKKDITYEISEDPVEAMLFLSAAIVTGSSILIEGCPIEFLELELLKLEKMGFKYDIKRSYLAANKKTKLVDIMTHPSKLVALEEKIHPLPSSAGINIDNLPFFVPIAIAAKGKTLIHDWVYENRAVYFPELNRLGANITLMDPHRVEIQGPSKLKGTEMVCPPALRPSAIILVAMLAAKGRSVLRNVYAVNRGYEKLIERLNKLGAEVELYVE